MLDSFKNTSIERVYYFLYVACGVFILGTIQVFTYSLQSVRYVSMQRIFWHDINAFVFRTVGLRFKSRAGQIGNSVANGSPPLWHFFEGSCVARRCSDVEMGPANSLYTSALCSEYNERFDLMLSSWKIQVHLLSFTVIQVFRCYKILL